MATLVNHTDEKAMKCPQCTITPEPKFEDELYVMTCPLHGHMALGSSKAQAIQFWNIYIRWTLSHTYRLMTEKKVKDNDSYCVTCEKYTRTIVVSQRPYLAECASCRLTKCFKGAA